MKCTSAHEKASPEEIRCLFDNYYARLVHFSFGITGDKGVSEDIVQDIFVKYWNASHLVSDCETAIKSYFYAGVRNASLNTLRHRAVEEKYLSTQDAQAEEQAVLHAIIRSEVLAELYSAIRSLPEGCREVSMRSYIQEMKNHEIAEELGITVNTVKTQKQRALKLLRLRLSPELLVLLVVLGVR